MATSWFSAFMLFIALLRLGVIASPVTPDTLGDLKGEISFSHVHGGEEYVVILAKNAPSPTEVLKRIGLSPEHIDVHHLFDNSAFRGFSAHMKPQSTDSLSKMKDVMDLEKVFTISSHTAIIEEAVRPNSTWGLQSVSSSSLPFGDPMSLTYTYTYTANSTLGRGVDIYVVDTGINTANIVFGNRARMGFSFTSDIADNDGHGTHVSGTAAGYIFGVASGASLIGVKVLGASGTGSTADALAGMDYVTKAHDQRVSQHPHFAGSIMSMSWGLPGMSRAVQSTISSVLSRGIHVSMAAGNSAGDACDYSPAAAGGVHSAAVSVGSIAPDGSISSFSNTGACVDLYAPGEDVLSAWIGGDNVVKFLSGTSMACPHVTGVMAYMLATDKGGTLAQNPGALKDRLLSMGLHGVVQGDAGAGDARLLLNNGMAGKVVDGPKVRLGALSRSVKRQDLEEWTSRIFRKRQLRLDDSTSAALRY